MKSIYLVWGFVIILLLVTVSFMGTKIINKNKEYQQIEDNMEEVVGKYLGQNLNEYPTNGSKKFNISYIINNGYEINLNVNEDKCNGYVIVTKENVGFNYKAYIKCNNYATKGYDD